MRQLSANIPTWSSIEHLALTLATYIACEHRGVALLYPQRVVLADGDPGKI